VFATPCSTRLARRDTAAAVIAPAIAQEHFVEHAGGREERGFLGVGRRRVAAP
jgi:hypothetical protein